MALDTERPQVSWHRSTLFSAFLVACTAFTCPGIFGALNGMGAGGGAKPGISNAANAIVFGTLTVFSPIVGGICNRIGPKWTLFIGTLGYAPYAAGLYLVDRDGVDWLLIFGAVILGLSACFLWVASGAIFMAYAEEHRKGLATSMKFAMQNLGASIGGIIELALNVRSDWRGSISHSTYIVLITIMCLGWPFALALPPPARVQRSDGRPVVITRARSLAAEYRVLWQVARTPTVVLLMPLMLYAQWFLSYQWQWNYAYLTVRARALLSMLFYLAGLIGALFFGQLLDWQRLRRRTRARIGFAIIVATSGSSWIIGQAVQVHYSKTKPTIDWVEDSFGLPCFLFILWGLSDPLVTTYMYWLLSTLTNNISETSFLASLVNSIGSLGSTFGFVVSAMDFSYNGACALNLALFWLAVPGTAYVAFTRVSETAHGKSLQDFSPADGADSSTVGDVPDLGDEKLRGATVTQL